MAEEQTEKSTSSRKRLVYIAMGALAVLAVLAAVAFLNKPQSPWAPTTMTVGDCGKDCIDLGSHNFAHAGDVQFYYDPDVDDAVVQWAGCLNSIVTCVVEGSNEEPQLIGKCVASSSCPQSCKKSFAKALKPNDEAQKQLDVIENIFLKDGAACNPKDS